MTHCLGEDRLTIALVARAATGDLPITIPPAAWARIAASEVIVEQHAQSGSPVYGLNTGLGGNLGTRIPREQVEAFQTQIIRGRTIGVGADLPIETCRAAMVCRLAELTLGRTGVSAAATRLLAEMVARDVVPVMPHFGSIGASDIGQLGHMASVMIGRGHAWFGGVRMAGGAALQAAGLTPLVPGFKDGLALVGHGCVTSAGAALSLHGIGRLLAAERRTVALAYEGFAANPAILDPRLVAARPAPGQAAAAAALLAMLAGSALLAPGAARSLQDVLCFRLAAPALGAADWALGTATEVLEAELNGSTTTPAVMLESGEILSSPNFHNPALTLALDMLASAVAHLASTSALRTAKLLTARFSGLPAYLSPVGGGSAGYVSLQKTAGDLLAEIRVQAQPSGLDPLAVSDTVEDVAPLSQHAVRRLDRQRTPFRYLVAMEALVAAQAVDLRGLSPLGVGTQPLHAAIREAVPPLAEDRESGLDVEAVARVIDRLG